MCIRDSAIGVDQPHGERANLGVILQVGQGLHQCVGGNDGVGVQVEQIVALSDGCPLVVSRRVTPILGADNEPRLGIARAHHLRAAVGRGVIDDDDLQAPRRRRGGIERAQAVVEELAGVIGDDDDGEIHEGIVPVLSLIHI